MAALLLLLLLAPSAQATDDSKLEPKVPTKLECGLGAVGGAGRARAAGLYALMLSNVVSLDLRRRRRTPKQAPHRGILTRAGVGGGGRRASLFKSCQSDMFGPLRWLLSLHCYLFDRFVYAVSSFWAGDDGSGIVRTFGGLG